MKNIDLSTEALLARRALAEKATPGKWKITGVSAVNGCYCHRLIYSDENPHHMITFMHNMSNCKCAEDAAHIAANSPDVVIASINEILNLRAQVVRLEKEVDWLAHVESNAKLHSVRAEARKAVGEA